MYEIFLKVAKANFGVIIHPETEESVLYYYFVVSGAAAFQYNHLHCSLRLPFLFGCSFYIILVNMDLSVSRVFF